MSAITVDAVLFDMDGTLIDSTPGVMVAWNNFASIYGFDAAVVARKSHGRRLEDTLKEFCKIEDEDKLSSEIARFEEEVIRGGPVALPGAIALIKQIEECRPTTAVSPGWTIVTSATNFYTPLALSRSGVPVPPAGFVCSNDVSRGKPHPDPYLAGAKKVGVSPNKCFVIEDAPSGIRSGHAAGAKTIAVCTSHSRQEIIESGSNPDYIVKDLTRLTARWMNGKLEITIDETVD
ncbi:HAD-like protein [Rickenella mellea]|uniref:HAD-like protein n=1 Tax=Rickenella mellea TaxID=50990 RepID=A0A4Y7QMM6_9AGAM|nr:HAD-like protein [Rickenella mellea]